MDSGSARSGGRWAGSTSMRSPACTLCASLAALPLRTTFPDSISSCTRVRESSGQVRATKRSRRWPASSAVTVMRNFSGLGSADTGVSVAKGGEHTVMHGSSRKAPALGKRPLHGDKPEKNPHPGKRRVRHPGRKMRRRPEAGATGEKAPGLTGVFRVFRSKERIQDDQSGADGDCGIRYVEDRPGIENFPGEKTDPHFQKIGDGAVNDAIREISGGAAQHQSETRRVKGGGVAAGNQ